MDQRIRGRGLDGGHAGLEGAVDEVLQHRGDGRRGARLGLEAGEALVREGTTSDLAQVDTTLIELAVGEAGIAALVGEGPGRGRHRRRNRIVDDRAEVVASSRTTGRIAE